MLRFKLMTPQGWGDEIGLRRLLVIAAARIAKGEGPFTVSRITQDGGRYAHPGLRRTEALATFGAIAKAIGPDAEVRAQSAAQMLIRAARVQHALYRNPLRDAPGVRGLRQDQGVDYSVTARAPVYAIGPGIVTVHRTTSGWPWDAAHSDGGAYVAYELTAGPAKGLLVYDAEHIVLADMAVGDSVDSGTVIATHLPGFANCEMGWAGAQSRYGYGRGDAPEAVDCYIEGRRTAAGDNFDQLMRALGAPPGLVEGRPIRCSLPKGYPPARRWAALLAGIS